jgi:hypothetical protein
MMVSLRSDREVTVANLRCAPVTRRAPDISNATWAGGAVDAQAAAMVGVASGLPRTIRWPFEHVSHQ